MYSKAVISVLVALAIIQQSFADDLELCPTPQLATSLFYKGVSHVAAPSSGRIENVVPIPYPPQDITCIAIHGDASAGQNGSLTVAAFGFSNRIITASLLSDIRFGIDFTVEAYLR